MKKIIAFVFSFIVLLSCKKEDSVTLQSGTFTGTFTVKYDSQTFTGPSTVTLESDGKYLSKANSNRMPAGGFGTYTKTADKITFEDMNYWTTDFDWGLILNGEYSYTFDGKNLRLIREINDESKRTYEYNLKRD